MTARFPTPRDTLRLPLVRGLALAVTTAALILLATACSPEIGDACLSNQECGTGAICDTTAPDGYCTITPCEPNSCPEESVCVDFDNDESFCMLRCSNGGDCRSGYACRDDRGPVKFCYVP